MGMFDSVWVKCPDCCGEVEFQSKEGDCCLRDYDITNMPMEIAADLAGKCARCDCGFAVIFNVTPQREVYIT